MHRTINIREISKPIKTNKIKEKHIKIVITFLDKKLLIKTSLNLLKKSLFSFEICEISNSLSSLLLEDLNEEN
ncbi:hypothetical protein [Methanobrevibacter sp.]|uniref:hypothetical protein n=1 Tax=Methanobrevibacter sp. TaxID=66852 RepID=UPI003890342C